MDMGPGLEEVAQLLTLSEEHFAIVGPTFLSELEKGYRNVNDELAMAQAFTAAGVRVEDIVAEYNKICEQIDAQLDGVLSSQKKDFLKRVMALTYNAVSETQGLTKRSCLIPIEYCHEDAKLPTYAHLTDAGMDVYTTEEITINPGETKLIPLGIKVALPIGYELQVRPKSGRSLKSKLRVANTPGTIDAGYRDEIGVIVDNIDPYIKHAEMDENGRLYNVEFGSSITIGKGEKFAQLVLSEVPKAVFYEVKTVAGMGEDRQGGFGSTGDK
jgi:dUTP pyrophosphatase